jgi:hypothetical protein
MKHLHPRTARLIRHRVSHPSGLYSAYLLFPPEAGGHRRAQGDDRGGRRGELRGKP